jgi:hypothetical protein
MKMMLAKARVLPIPEEEHAFVAKYDSAIMNTVNEIQHVHGGLV